MCECCLCCECCPCCAHHRKLVEEGHTRLIESPKLEDSVSRVDVSLRTYVSSDLLNSDLVTGSDAEMHVPVSRDVMIIKESASCTSICLYICLSVHL